MDSQDNQKVIYYLDDVNIDEIFDAFGRLKTSAFEPCFAELEEAGVEYERELVTVDGEIIDEFSYVATTVTVEKSGGEKPETALWLNARGYLWDEDLTRILPESIKIKLGTVPNGIVTTSILLVRSQLEQRLQDSILDYYAEL